MKKRSGLCVGLILLGVALLIPWGEGRGLAPMEKWVARYNSGNERAYAIAVDGSGNVYVTGRDSRYRLDPADYATIKYNTNGKQLWVATYNGPYNGSDCANAIAVDGSGNVYVTGRSLSSNLNSDYATIKYDTNGQQLWVSRYAGPGYSNDTAEAVALDGAGNVYVTGSSYGAGSATDYATIKYDTNGKQLWVKRYNGPGNDYDYAQAIAVDGLGNVYITGSSTRSGNTTDYATIKYDTNGKQLWVTKYNGPGNGDDEASAIAADGAGNVYVTGKSVWSGTDYDYATIKYNSNGKQIWVKKYNGPAGTNYCAPAIALDGSGNVYVTGGSLGSGANNDYATIKYDTNGIQIWVKRYNGPGNKDDTSYAIAVDGSGNIYVTGESLGSGTDHDYATIKYNTNGKQIWVKRYNGPGNDDDGAEAIAVDGSGNVYVTGASTGKKTGYDFATIKY